MQRYHNLMASKQEERSKGGKFRILMLVDSGASDHVVPANEIPGIETVAGEASKKQVHYVAADGGRIPNLGEQHLQLIMADNKRVRVTFQVADVTRPILSVSRLSEAGHKVSFSKEGGTITHGVSGAVIPFTRFKGVYVLEAWVDEPVAGFPRQATRR